MRMLMTSNGVHDGPLRDALVGLLDGPVARARSVVVLDAILPFPGDKGTLLAYLDAYRALGWAEVDLLTLASGSPALVASRLLAADVVHCYGGSNHWLAHAWAASGLVPVLQQVLEQRVHLGMSAGSMIFSRLHAAAVEALDDHEEVGMLQLGAVGPALPLFDWFPVPHLGAPFMPHATDTWAAGVAARLGGPSWFLDDDSALLVRDADAEPGVVSGGHWLRFDDRGTLVASDRGDDARAPR